MIALSILTPAVPSRLSQLSVLCKWIEKQIGSHPVEHLVLLDNKRRTVGEKRDALLRAARGNYVAFVDDDDFITAEYVSALIEKTEFEPHVITFHQLATVNGVQAEIEFKLGNPNEPFPSHKSSITQHGPIVRRNAWHVCAWRRDLAILSHFPASNYGEDWAYAEPLCRLAKREEHIPAILHHYQHNATTTEAPPP